MRKIIATSLIALSIIAGAASAVSAGGIGSADLDFSGYPHWAQDAFTNEKND